VSFGGILISWTETFLGFKNENGNFVAERRAWHLYRRAVRAHPRSHLGRIAITLVIVGAAAGIGAEDLVTGQLEIRGAVLRVSPERQEVSPGLPTVVLTASIF